jgi:hypothetical protein
MTSFTLHCYSEHDRRPQCKRLAIRLERTSLLQAKERRNEKKRGAAITAGKLYEALRPGTSSLPLGTTEKIVKTD